MKKSLMKNFIFLCSNTDQNFIVSYERNVAYEL